MVVFLRRTLRYTANLALITGCWISLEEVAVLGAVLLTLCDVLPGVAFYFRSFK